MSAFSQRARVGGAPAASKRKRRSVIRAPRPAGPAIVRSTLSRPPAGPFVARLFALLQALRQSASDVERVARTSRRVVETEIGSGQDFIASVDFGITQVDFAFAFQPADGIDDAELAGFNIAQFERTQKLISSVMVSAACLDTQLSSAV